MARVLLLFLFSFYIGIDAYPNVRIDQRIPGWKASGFISYAWCGSTNFELEFGEYTNDSRGGCLLTYISADMIKGNQSIRTIPYRSSGTKHV